MVGVAVDVEVGTSHAQLSLPGPTRRLDGGVRRVDRR